MVFIFTSTRNSILFQGSIESICKPIVNWYQSLILFFNNYAFSFTNLSGLQFVLTSKLDKLTVCAAQITITVANHRSPTHPLLKLKLSSPLNRSMCYRELLKQTKSPTHPMSYGPPYIKGMYYQ